MIWSATPPMISRGFYFKQFIMKNELQVNPNKFGIEKSKANELIGSLPQIIKERSELEKQFNEVIKMDIESSEASKSAKQLRLLIQKNRTQGINNWHRTTKDYFLKGGQFVDAIKRKEIAVNERMEKDLQQIEKYAEIKEQERLEKLQQDRVKELSKYVEDAEERDLKSMEEDVWKAYLSTKKQEHEERIAAEKKAEQERLENERLDKIENERRYEIAPYVQFDKGNHDLRNMSDKDYKDLLKSLQNAKIEHDKEQEEIRKENERLRKERESEAKKQAELEDKRKAEEAKKEAEHQAQLKKEREQREALERAEKQRKEAEEKAKAEEEARLQAELNKGDADKVKDLIEDLTILKNKYTFKSAKNKKMYEDVNKLIDKVINYIN